MQSRLSWTSSRTSWNCGEEEPRNEAHRPQRAAATYSAVDASARRRRLRAAAVCHRGTRKLSLAVPPSDALPRRCGLRAHSLLQPIARRRQLPVPRVFRERTLSRTAAADLFRPDAHRYSAASIIKWDSLLHLVIYSYYVSWWSSLMRTELNPTNLPSAPRGPLLVDLHEAKATTANATATLSWAESENDGGAPIVEWTCDARARGRRRRRMADCASAACAPNERVCEWPERWLLVPTTDFLWVSG